MRPTVAALLIHFILIASATTPISPDEARENFDREFKSQLRDDDPRKQGIANALQIYAGCKEKKWSCQKPCRAQIPLKGNDSVPYCTTPHPEETCFGLPINYMYVSSRDQLPAEYEVLRRFPKCWSFLGPMLCGMIYRPCGVYEFSARLTSTMHKMEIWQRFGITMCDRVRNKCEDAIKEGFFPSELIDCKRTVENATWAKEKTNAKGALARFVPNGNEEELKTEWDRQTVFTEEACHLKYGESASKFEDMQCIFPLVHTMHETIKPIIDKCFLPCRNPLISSPDKFLSFRITRAVICFFFAIVCLAIFFFLSSRSKIFVDSHCIFSIACCFLSFAVYLICWGLGSISFFSEAAECMRTVHNVLIRTTMESTWCSISAVVSHVSLLASIGFLAAAFPLSAAGATKAVERIKQEKEEKMGDKSAAGFRAKLVLLIVTVSIAIGLIALVLELVTTDGVAGVCSVGLHSLFHHLMVVAFPGIFFCLIGLLWGAFDIWKEKRLMRMEIEQMIEDRIREGIDHEKAKKKIEFWTDRGGQQKEDMQEQVRQGSLPPLEEKEGESSGGAGGEEMIERDGEKEILVLIGDDDDKEWISDAQKKEISDAMRMEHAEDWRARERVAWYEAISSRYTLVAICLCIVSLIFGLCVHYTFLANDGTAEQDAVRSYVTCVMSKSIMRKDLHWMTHPVHAAEMWREGAGENDPLVRRHNLASEIVIHSCQYPSTGDGRIVGILTIFIGLPLLPICVFIWAFVAGIIGVGGMVMVKARRPKPIKSSGSTDVEMTAFTTERDEGSQIISSVASSIGDRVFPSSTLSTALSESSITSSSPSLASSSVSSTHSSVSLRGALPRFSSAERLITVRATSPVPSAARSEQVAVPDRRSRSVGHHRVLDVMSRARERREKSNKKTKKRATSEEMNARREGVAESGQLVAPRNAVDADCARSTASTHSAGSRGLFSTVSSTMIPPSEVCRRVLKNAEVHMSRSRQINRGTALQRQLQIVQEELLLGAPSRDQENVERVESDGNSELQKLSAIRDGIRLFVEDPLHANTAQSGMLASGLAITLVRTAIANNLFNMDANREILLFASRQLQYLAFHLEENLKLSPETAQDIAAAVNMLQMQIQFNNAPNAREILIGQRIEHINEGFEELDNLRQDFYRAVGDDERRAEIMNAMTEATRRHYILRVMARREQHDEQRLQLQQQQQPAASIQLQPHIQNGNNGNGASIGRPPVYSPMQRIDLRLPPTGANSARSEASYSVGGSSVPSSCMSPDEEDDQIKLYKELHRQPPMYVGPSTGDTAAPAADNAQTESSGVQEFMSQVMEMNNRSTEPPAYARQTGHFEVPTRSELGTESVVSDVMSSETSIDSMDRRMIPSTAFSSGSYSVPVYDVLPERRDPETSTLNRFRPNGIPSASALARLSSGVMPQVPRFPNSQPLGIPTTNNGANTEHSMEHAREQLDRLNLVDVPNGEVGKGKKERKRKAHPLEEPTTSSSKFGNANGPSKRDSPQPPPPGVNRIELVPREEANAAAAELEARSSGSRDQLEEGEDDCDSGVESLDSLTQLNLRLYVEESEGSEGGMRPATKEELERYAKTVQRQIEERLSRRGELERDDAGPSHERRRMERAHLMNRYMNHSDPDLAMEEEERERREAENEEMEMEERRRVANAIAHQRERERQARVGGENEEEPDEDSISSALTAEEQRELVLALRDSLAQRLTDDMEPRHQRMVAHMRRAIDEHGSISREEIMRFRVEETNLENRARQNPDRNSPYSVSSVAISRMSLGEIGARADAIRALSSTNIYPLEVYYQLHLADVLWPLAGRDVMMGDNVYTHDEINRVLGADSPAVPAGADSNDFHQLMRKRAITAASLTGRAYGRKRGSEGFQYQPPRLPDQGVYQLLGDPSVILSAIEGDMEPLREAIDRIPMTMPDVMSGPHLALSYDVKSLDVDKPLPFLHFRLDVRTEQTLGSHLRHFRDYLDSRARMVGYELREDTYQDLVPPEPTGSRRSPRDTNDNTNEEDDDDAENDADPDF